MEAKHGGDGIGGGEETERGVDRKDGLLNDVGDERKEVDLNDDIAIREEMKSGKQVDETHDENKKTENIEAKKDLLNEESRPVVSFDENSTKRDVKEKGEDIIIGDNIPPIISPISPNLSSLSPSFFVGSSALVQYFPPSHITTFKPFQVFSISFVPSSSKTTATTFSYDSVFSSTTPPQTSLIIQKPPRSIISSLPSIEQYALGYATHLIIPVVPPSFMSYSTGTVGLLNRFFYNK
jgi:hypothetical protein